MLFGNVLNATHEKNSEELVSAAQCLVWRSEASTTSIEAVTSPKFVSRGQSFQTLDELDGGEVEDAEKSLGHTTRSSGKGREGDYYCENTVFLNVYDIVDANGFLYHAGLGAHHTGIEVYNTEIAFGRCEEGTGVYITTPKVGETHTFREQLILGETLLTRDEVFAVVREFMADNDWSGQSYHIVKRNCNNFSEALARRLLPAAVRVQQVGIVDLYDSGEREEVTLEDGTVAEVPVLVPKWVNRLARTLGSLPDSLLDRIDGS